MDRQDILVVVVVVLGHNLIFALTISLICVMMRDDQV